MSRLYKNIALVLVVFLIACVNGVAQEKIEVRGKVVGKDSGEPMSEVYVYSFSTRKELDEEFVKAENYRKEQNNSTKVERYQPDTFMAYGVTDARGYYSVSAVPDGGLLYCGPFNRIERAYVNRRSNITAQIDETEIIEEGGVGGDVVVRPEVIEAEQQGDAFKVVGPYFFDKEKLGEVKSVTRTNSRLIAQMYLVDHDGNIVKWFKPRVLDGVEYHTTQRIKAPDDYRIVLAEQETPLTESKDSLMFCKVVRIPDKDRDYYCMAKITLRDYNIEYYTDALQLFNTARVSRPFQFLEYAFEYGHLNHGDFRRDPTPQTLTVPRDMKLEFNAGKAGLNRSDRATMDLLQSLKDELSQVEHLDSLVFEGFASPEGSYKTNLQLSQSRTRTVMNYVLSALPGKGRGVKPVTSGTVMPWGKVADLLAADSLFNEAAEIRLIEQKFKDNPDAQDKKIRKLKYYPSAIKPRLETLRMVRCTYKYQVFRERTIEEALQVFNQDPEFKADANNLTPYDFWRLFELEKDEKRLETLYRVAFEKSIIEDKNPWELPANNLAVMMLGRGQADTTLLAPFISFGYGLNDMRSDGVTRVNLEPVVHNQVLMYMLDGNYKSAVQLSSKFLKDSDPTLHAIVSCLGGYVGFDKDDQKTIDKIRRSSGRNRVIIDMYQRHNPDSIAARLNRLPSDDPVTYYMKAQNICKEHSCITRDLKQKNFNREQDSGLEHPKDTWTTSGSPEKIEENERAVRHWKEKLKEYQHPLYKHVREYCQSMLNVAEVELSENIRLIKINVDMKAYDAAKIYLKKCFKMDSKYKEIAKRDGDINEDLLNEVLAELEKEDTDE